MLSYLSGIGAPRPATRQAKKVAKQAQKTAIVKAKVERKAIQQQARQQRLTSAGTFVAPVVKKVATTAVRVAKKTPAALVVQRIKKAKVEGQKRAAFKRAGEPLAVSPSDIFAEPQEIQNADIEFEQGEQEIDEPEFEQNEFENNDMQDEMGIIYPGFAGPKKQAQKAGSKKTLKQKASLNPEAQKKTQLNPEAKAKKNAAIQKLKTQVVNVAKATLEAKGIKFPSKEQVKKEVEEIAPTEKKKGFMLPLLIGGGAIAVILLLKKK